MIYLQDVLDGWLGAGRARVILPITDPYVVHHGALGSFATVYLPEGVTARAAAASAGRARRAWRSGAGPRARLPALRAAPRPRGRSHRGVRAPRGDRHERWPRHDLSGLDAPLRSHGGHHASRRCLCCLNRPTGGEPGAAPAPQLRHLRPRPQPRPSRLSGMPRPTRAWSSSAAGIVGDERRLPSGQARLARRGAARAGEPLRRHHLARGGAGRPAPLLQQSHPAHPLQRRSLQPPRGGDGPGHRDGSGAAASSVARTAERMVQLQRNAALANAYGIEAHVISLERGGARYPLMRTDDLVGRGVDPGRRQGQSGRYHPGAGPGRAGGRGALIREGVKVTGVRIGAAARRRRRDLRRGPSPRRSSSTARACGRGSSGA